MGGYVFVRLVLQLSAHGTRGMGGYFTTGRTRALLPRTLLLKLGGYFLYSGRVQRLEHWISSPQESEGRAT